MSTDNPPLMWRGYPLDAFAYRRTVISVHGITAQVGDMVTIATSPEQYLTGDHLWKCVVGHTGPRVVPEPA